jgi:8-oxo-dGTP pyrophosphatase MutT (NUDIX family)
MSPSRPVRPRHAASLVLVRRANGHAEILMGRRPKKAAFIPDAFVFPGGRLDPSDALVRPSAPLAVHVVEDLCMRGGCSPKLARTLATTAIRETFEETGIALVARGDPGRSDGVWAEFKAHGWAPAHERLRFLGRAITPTSSPIRFHARFFTAHAEPVHGILKSNGELSDLDWYPLADAQRLPVIDVTQFVLAEIAAEEQGRARTAPFFRYRRNRPLAKSADA